MGACPTGAVVSREAAGEAAEAATATVIACTRSGLEAAALPSGVELLKFDCVGRASVAMMLDRLAHGSRGVLVLGRHQEICRHRGAEDPARRRAQRVNRLAELLGLGLGRVRFEVPAAGPEGPGDQVRRFLAELEDQGPAIEMMPESLTGIADEGLDSALVLAGLIAAESGVEPIGRRWLEQRSLPAAKGSGPVLLTGALPCLEVLGGELFRPLVFTEVLATASAILSQLLGATVGLSVGPLGADLAQVAARHSDGGQVYTLDADDAQELREAGLEVTLMDDLLREQRRACSPSLPVACFDIQGSAELVEALGHEPLEVGPDPLPPDFSMSPRDRMTAELLLQRAQSRGARLLLVSSPMALARWALICRHGTWRASTIRPVLGVQLAAPGTAGEM